MEALTEQEFKLMCQWFHENGTEGIDFETSWKAFVDEVMRRQSPPVDNIEVKHETVIGE